MNIGFKRGLHAYLLVSQDFKRREESALELARTILCDGDGEGACGICRHCRLVGTGMHPDICFIERQLDDKGKPKRDITVDAVRRMSADAWVLPQDADKRVFIIREAHLMNVQAQNAALKVIEEPPRHAVFILSANSPEELLPTIRSRCSLVYAGGERQTVESELATEFLGLVFKGRESSICAFLTSCEACNAEQISDMLTVVSERLCVVLRDEGNLADRRQAAHVIEVCRKGQEFLQMNVSVKHVLGMLAASQRK